MSKMIFNGLEFVAGQEINNNGVFIDTDNLIDSGTYISEFTYTAIQDCCLLFHVAGTTSTSGKLYIDGIVFQGIYTNSSNNDYKDYTFLKKGQVAKITSSQNVTLEYAVYGLQSGSVSNVQHNYSTSEQLIGTWIDGKPLYQKTWSNLAVAILSANTWVSTGISATEIDTIVDGTMQDDNKQKISGTIGFMSSHTYIGVYPQIGNRALKSLTIQYTKTTD